MTILMFWTKFAQKGYFPSKTEKSEYHYWILHIRVSFCTKFELKLTILGVFFDPISGRKRKNPPVRASVVVTYYIKLFSTGADRYTGILMSLLLLVAEIITNELVS